MTKRVLVVAMLDSIHTANWIERFVDSDVIIEIYPSRKFRSLHPKTSKLLLPFMKKTLIGPVLAEEFIKSTSFCSLSTPALAFPCLLAGFAYMINLLLTLTKPTEEAEEGVLS